MIRKPFFISKSVSLLNKRRFLADNNLHSHWSIVTLRWKFSDILFANLFLSREITQGRYSSSVAENKISIRQTIFTIPQLQTAMMFVFQDYFILLYIIIVWICFLPMVILRSKKCYQISECFSIMQVKP